VHFREPQQIFIDITRSIPLWTSEEELLSQALTLAQSLGFSATAAISETPWGAQVLSENFERYITTPGQDFEALAPLPVPALRFLEGLMTWREPQLILQIANFFETVGLRYLIQLRDLSSDDFHARWGETGKQIWRRLHNLEKQVISPLLPTEPFRFYQYLNEPVENSFFLLLHLEESLKYLFARLEGRCQDAQSLKLHLRCEYSKHFHDLIITPVKSSRDQSLYLDLLKQKLETLDLFNPIRDFEIQIESVSTETRQLDFWQPQTSVEDKLQRLMSVLKQADCETGFARLQNAVFPEDSFCLENSHQEFAPRTDSWNEVDGNFQILPALSCSLGFATRPTRLLQEPLKLNASEVASLQVLTRYPFERLENAWWENEKRRDYYLSLSPQGQCIWLYQDLQTNAYFIHGYFD
jgi:hypothetical protein